MPWWHVHAWNYMTRQHTIRGSRVHAESKPSMFQLEAPFQPAGDQPQAIDVPIAGLRKRIDDGDGIVLRARREILAV